MQDLKQLFDNNFDCSIVVGRNEEDIEQAMTKDKFIEVVEQCIKEITDDASYLVSSMVRKQKRITELQEALKSEKKIKEWYHLEILNQEKKITDLEKQLRDGKNNA